MNCSRQLGAFLIIVIHHPTRASDGLCIESGAWRKQDTITETHELLEGAGVT